MKATTVYEALKSAIDAACEAEVFLAVRDAAVQLGMVGGEKESLTVLGYEYEYADDSGGSVHLYIRSYDPSGPFQNEPDINRFTAKLSLQGRQVATHDRQYTD